MKFIAVLLWVLPFFAAAQVLPPAPLASSTPAVAVPDSSAGWELRLDYEARTTYLGREYGHRDYCLNPQVSYSASSKLKTWLRTAQARPRETFGSRHPDRHGVDNRTRRKKLV